MPFHFSEVCTLLSSLEDLALHDPPILSADDKAAHEKRVVERWFKQHRSTLNGLDVDNTIALLSILLPERRTDRVYGIQPPSLCRILGRSLGLSTVSINDLQAHKEPGRGDLALCLERVLKAYGPPAQPPICLHEVDDMLNTLAGRCRFSERYSKPPPGSSELRDKLVGDICKRLDASQSKWLVRSILKDLAPVRVNEALVLQIYHFLLPDVLRFQNNLETAIKMLKGPLHQYPYNPDPRSQRLHRRAASKFLQPKIGVKVGRPLFYKARSIDHCMTMCGSGRWVLERKYDGEYCEVHIDMTRSRTPSECITIFSKSGKNSTHDRESLHRVLVNSLQLGSSRSKIKRQAILLGELVVYSDKENTIVSFGNIRKYVSRSGKFIGADQDSPAHDYEHLSIVFFDILLLDDEIVMRRPLDERRMWLREVYSKVDGRAMSTEWKIVDFKDTDRARNSLIQQFAASEADRQEGLVLKPCDMPYFNLDSTKNDYVNGFIKLKKDYIEDMGDEADFAVVGGSYNGQHALMIGLQSLHWTSFHLGCLVNKIDVLRYAARPRFRVVGSIDAEHCIPVAVLQAANDIGRFCSQPHTPSVQPSQFDVDCPLAMKMHAVFDEPFVFEVLGSAFEKPSNCNFFMLRHPRVKKLHRDRTWRDCVSFEELQEQAIQARAAPIDSASQETRRLIAKLTTKCKKKKERQQTITPQSKTLSTAASRPYSTPADENRANTALVDFAPPTGPRDVDSRLNGSTLVDTKSATAKRLSKGEDCTPCPTNKRVRREQTSKGASKPSQGMLHNPASSNKGTPLSDITNTAPNSSSPVLSRRTEQPTKRGTTLVQSETPETYPTSLCIAKCSKASVSREHSCDSRHCLFAEAAVFLAACIASTPYIVEDLLRPHSVVMIANLAHWDRDSFSYPPLVETVSESQAFKGMRKIVLVEARRTNAMRQTIDRILALNMNRWRERVEIYDWRVLEKCLDSGLRAGEAKTYFLGATMFDENRERTIFVENSLSGA